MTKLSLINEVSSLMEDIEQHSEGFEKSVLFEAVQVSEFSEPMSGEALIQKLAEAKQPKYQVKVGKDFPVGKVNVVQFRTCELFDRTLEKHPEVQGKLDEFIAAKTADPMAQFGRKDQHFTAGGILVASGCIHAHLNFDVSVLYRRSGKNPTIIDLVAVVSHDELGMGQPRNQKQQKKMVKIINDQEFK